MKEMRKFISIKYFILVGVLSLSSCMGDLDLLPIDPNVTTTNNVFKDPAAYKQALAKIYASYAISGQTGGGGGNADISDIDENFGNYLRQYWGMQELSTDEAIMAWDDATIKNFHWHTWASNDVFISALYSRIFYSITISNEFIRNVNTGLASATGDFATELKEFHAEARFLRALSYWHAIDMFGNVPFVTESDKPGAFFPSQIARSDLFEYIESELKDLETKLVPARQNEYARADQAAAWMVLAKLYMNAKVYTGTERYSDALIYINKIIDAGYSIDSNYKRVFSADNHLSPEIIFPFAFDGQNTQQYGGMTFLLHASNGGKMPLNGIDGGWGGIRTIKDFVGLFNISQSNFTIDKSDPEKKNWFLVFDNGGDVRADFFFSPEEVVYKENDADITKYPKWDWNITNVGTFTQGIGVTKFQNLTSTGEPAPNAHPTFVSTDFPMFRLADVYLMYAEAVLRGGTGGNVSTALDYVNELRERAYGDASGNIEADDLTLQFIIDERGRELYWEGHRRTDLIRFGLFTGGDYLWEWKGNVASGAATENFRNLYPIPSSDRIANPTLDQNEGYN